MDQRHLWEHDGGVGRWHIWVSFHWLLCSLTGDSIVHFSSHRPRSHKWGEMEARSK